MSNPNLVNKNECMLLAWKGIINNNNPNYISMKQQSLDELNERYHGEKWLLRIDDIFERLSVRSRKTIVVDLWALYYLQKEQVISILNCFDKVFVTHNTVCMALHEISNVNDDVIKTILSNFQFANNIEFKSPTIKEQLLIRKHGFKFMEIHHALLLAELLDCPAFVGEFRFPIPDRFKDRIIRPNNFAELLKHIVDTDN